MKSNYPLAAGFDGDADLQTNQSEPTMVQVIPKPLTRECQVYVTSSTPPLPFKIPQIPSNRGHKALKKGTLGGVGQTAACGASHEMGQMGVG